MDNGRSFFSGLYQWKDKTTGEKNSVRDISEILRGCGFDSYNLTRSKQRQPCVITTTLRSPRVQWLDLGKSNINLDPFAKIIAKATISVARQMPTFHGYGGCSGYAKSLQDQLKDEKPPSKVECLRILLKERYDAVKANPDIKTTKRWTQSNVWYTLTFGLFQKYGYTSENHKIAQGKGGTRDYITGLINDTCLELFGVKGRNWV